MICCKVEEWVRRVENVVAAPEKRNADRSSPFASSVGPAAKRTKRRPLITWVDVVVAQGGVNGKIANAFTETTCRERHVRGGRGCGHDSDEAETRSKRAKQQVQAKNKNRNNTIQHLTIRHASRPADSIHQWLDLPVLLLVIVCYS